MTQEAIVLISFFWWWWYVSCLICLRRYVAQVKDFVFLLLYITWKWESSTDLVLRDYFFSVALGNYRQFFKRFNSDLIPGFGQCVFQRFNIIAWFLQELHTCIETKSLIIIRMLIISFLRHKSSLFYSYGIFVFPLCF